MKVIKLIFSILFSIILILPVIFFNFKKEAISEIDNRMLAEKPTLSGDNKDVYYKELENYVNDRIGFRDEMILSWTVLNDKIFNKMVHPSYTYGKDGYVFGAGITTNTQYTDFYKLFASTVEALQKYCEERDIPFLFVFNPAKPAIMTEYLKEGINYDRVWVDEMLMDLEQKGIRYLDNTKILREKYEEGEMVYNKKFDANHWNALGAFYGTSNILNEIKKDFPSTYVNQKSDIILGESIATSLLVSKFPINEKIPSIEIKDFIANEEKTEKYKEEIYLHPSFQNFSYYTNERRKEDAPKALVFQGSFMNGYGKQFMANGLGEYISIHDYMNVINMPYYYNIFRPDCVIFEVAEYAISWGNFNSDAMRAINYNPLLSNVEQRIKDTQDLEIVADEISVEEGETLTKIMWSTEHIYDYVWYVLDNEYDMQKTEFGYEVTVLSDEYKKYFTKPNIFALEGDALVKFR